MDCTVLCAHVFTDSKIFSPRLPEEMVRYRTSRLARCTCIHGYSLVATYSAQNVTRRLPEELVRYRTRYAADRLSAIAVAGTKVVTPEIAFSVFLLHLPVSKALKVKQAL